MNTDKDKKAFDIKPYSFVQAIVVEIEDAKVLLSINTYRMAVISLSDIEGGEVSIGDIVEAEVVNTNDGEGKVVLGWGRIVGKAPIEILQGIKENDDRESTPREMINATNNTIQEGEERKLIVKDNIISPTELTGAMDEAKAQVERIIKEHGLAYPDGYKILMSTLYDELNKNMVYLEAKTNNRKNSEFLRYLFKDKILISEYTRKQKMWVCLLTKTINPNGIETHHDTDLIAQEEIRILTEESDGNKQEKKYKKSEGYHGGYDILGKRIIMSGTDKINELQIGDVFLFGNQDRPIPWTVYSLNSTQLFLLCNYVLFQKTYIEALDYLKYEFRSICFTNDEKDYINDVCLPGKDYIMQKLNDEERVGVHIRRKMRSRSFYYWTCTSGNKGTHYSININGHAVVSSDWEKLGVRPFLVLNKLKSEGESEPRKKEQPDKQPRKFIKVW